MNQFFTKSVLLSAFAACAACSFHARGPEDYRDATAALLETRAPAIKQCYDAALKSQPDLQGTVTIKFIVQEETGQIANTQVVDEGSTAPDALKQCVVTAVNGLVLDPPDAREGQATFVYQFSVNPPPAAPAAALERPALQRLASNG